MMGEVTSMAALIVGASMTQGVHAACQSLPRQALPTPVVSHATLPAAPGAAALQYIWTFAGMAAQNGGGAHATVDCPVGTYAIGGGFSSGGSDIAVSEDAPDSSHTSWSVDIQNNDPSPQPLNAYAICVESSGTPGSPGGAGTQDIPGITNLHYISASGGVAPANGGNAHTTVNCPVGTYVISGGLSSAGSNIAVSESAPNSNHTSWIIDIQNNDHSATLMNAYAVCATIG